MPNRGPQRSVKRRRPFRSPQERTLVVCEGEYTEPRYFAALKDHLRLNTLVIKPAKGVDPRTLVNLAHREDRQERRKGERFDFVYCVFDRDSHPQFDEASQTARDRGFRLARSWPCFEFWLLLHFVFSRASYVASGSRSACDACIRALRRHLPEYDKGDQTTFDDLWHLLGVATANARRAMADAEDTGERNPSTEVYELVEHLKALPALNSGRPAGV